MSNPTKIILQSTITCPGCGHAAEETMPGDACQWYYECKACGELLKPLQGDCCVFCSYGTVPCPPVQLEGDTDGCRPGFMAAVIIRELDMDEVQATDLVQGLRPNSLKLPAYTQYLANHYDAKS